MKFTVDLEDFWLDEDASDIETELKNHIINSVVFQIGASIKEKVDTQISKTVNEVIERKLTTIIDDKLSDLIDIGTITRNRKEISIVDHVKEVFEDNNGWGSADKKIERIAKEFGHELKLQYNNAFANKIVMNMKEQGLLKDEVVQILLSPK